MEMEMETEKMETEIIRWFDEVSEEAGRTQTETLRRILEENCGVEYLRKYVGGENLLMSFLLLNGKEDDSRSCRLEEIYRKLVPLSSHSDFEPFIQRIADGDDTNPLLTLNPITALSLSSGTTDGRQKLVPFTRHTTLTTFQIFSLASAYRSRVYPIIRELGKGKGKKALQLIYSSKQYKTKGGLTVGTATTHIYESEEFKNKSNYLSCSPQEVISSGDYRQSTYCHLLLGLFFSQDIDYITSTFSYSVVQALASFEEFYREICHDIRFGTLTNRITLPNVRKAVLEIITPNPSLASEIEFICNELEQLNWAGLIPRLWPNAKYVCSIMTGSMQPYTKKLRHYGGELPLVSADYGSTESWIGVNVDPSLPPEMVSFAVVPSFSYFEFIPVHKPDCLIKSMSTGSSSFHHNQYLIEDEPVTLSQVKVGQQYELVLTTFTGLYRYRLGDIVEVSGFHKGTPKISFVCRRNLILTINIDKNTEKDLQLVVERASQVLSLSGGGELVDFTSHAVTADVENETGHYVVYWEIKGEVEDRVLEECCKEMDGSFVDHGYVVSRRCGSIGPLELRVVEGGTFKKILDYFVEKGGALSQFKTPRCTSNSVLLDILNAGTIRTFYSTAYN